MMTITHSKPTIDSADIQAVRHVLSSGKLVQSNEVEAFEKEVARFLGLKGGVAVSSGTSALHLALLVLGVDEHSEVLLPSYACSALLQAVNYVGAKPVFLDTDPETLFVDPDEVKRKRTKKTKAFILVHPFGYPVDVSFYSGLGLPIIEDVATSIGAKIGRDRIGGEGKVTIASFYATKMMTTGEGGMFLSDQLSLLKQVKKMRQYDEATKFEVSFNYKMTDFQAALGRSQLKKLPAFIQKRNQWARQLNSFFEEVPDVELPIILPGAKPAYHRYLFRVKKSEIYLRKMNEAGIQARRPVFKPLHHYMKLRGFPGTELLMKEMVSLPIYPALTKKEFLKIMNAQKKYFK